MATAYRSSTSANTGSSTASSLSINLPAGATANDILVACIGVSGGSGATVTPPTGWTQVSSVSQSTNIQLVVFWYRTTGYEAASFTWTFDSARQASGILEDYSGAYAFVPPTPNTNTVSTPGTTSAVAGPSNTYFTGMILVFFGAYNTTAASTMTANGSFTQRVDTCTTASSFIEVAAQDNYHGTLTIGGLTTNAATISQSATSVSVGFILEDARPNYTGLVEDEYGSGSKDTSTTYTSVTGSTYSVNMPNEVLIMFVIVAQSVATVSSITGGGLTWVNVGRSNTNNGSVELWRTFASAPSTFAPTLNFSVGIKSSEYLLVGFVGADMTGTNGSGAIGAFGTASSSSAAPTVSITTTRNNSWVWGAGNDPTANPSVTAGSNQTVIRNVGDSTNVCKSWIQRQNAITAASGTNVTINDTAPTTDSCNILAVEILPAIHYNLASTGVG